jgi:hypothetical protein
MNRVDVTKQLEEIVTSGDDFEWQSGQLTEEWENEPKSLEIVEAILQFMESHPEIEYGTPGSLVHFVEAFPNYKEKIIESVERKPTPHTVWMLDRVINGEQDQRRRDALIAVLRRVLENPAADLRARNRASDSLEFQMQKR